MPPPTTSKAATYDSRLFPNACRQIGRSYTAPLLVTMQRQIDDAPVEQLRVSLGEIPILVLSNKCHLNGLSERGKSERTPTHPCRVG